MGFDIRLAGLNGAGMLADIHARSWIFAYSECVPMDIIEKRNSGWPAMWNKLLADNCDSHYAVTYDDKIIGFLTVNPSRDADLSGTAFELTGLYLDPDFVGQGFGKKTVDWVKAEAAARGFNTVVLWVLDENRRAKAFYEKCGFWADGKAKPSGLGDAQEERYILVL